MDLIIISNHAHKRLEQRLTRNKYKFEKIAAKAWHSKLSTPKKCKVHKDNNKIYKFFSGFIFAFTVEKKSNHRRVVLVTVFNHKQTYD